jgi:hypothetical protein
VGFVIAVVDMDDVVNDKIERARDSSTNARRRDQRYTGLLTWELLLIEQGR